MSGTAPDTRGLPRAADVVIVGSGPTGLTLACALADLGVDAVLLDASDTIRTDSRAAGVQPRTLETLARIGLADELVSRGLTGSSFAAVDRDRTLIEVPFTDLDTPYPFVLLVPQNITEEVLATGLAARGRVVHRDHRVLGVRDGHGGAEVSVVGPDGVVRSIRARYVVGADGLHSTVRDAAGIPFDGVAGDQDYALADARLEGWTEPPRVTFCFSPHGLLVLSPLPDGTMRVVGNVDRPLTATVDDVQRLLDERGPAGSRVTVTEVVRSSPYRVSTKIARRFSSGHVFVAGDAAHVHSPAGGQGMNTGIQDAVNLAWKLAAVVDGTSSPELLDSYDAERRPNAHGLLGFTAQLTALAELRDPTETALRNDLLSAAGRNPLTAPYLAEKLSQLGVGYRAPGAPAAGGGVAQPGERVAPTGDWARTLRWALLVPPADVEGATAAAQGSGAVVGTHAGSGILLVRPDGYLAARRDAAAPADVAALLAHVPSAP